VLDAYLEGVMSKKKILGAVVGAIAIGLGYAASSVWVERGKCATKAAEAKVEWVYYLRHGCLFRMPEGWSSVIYKSN
jgi:hypothetical protein